MNYSILIRPQEARTLPSGAKNMGSPPLYPPGASLCWRSQGQNLYSDNPADRSELLFNPSGTATVEDVRLQLPQLIDYRLQLINIEAEARIEKAWPLLVRTNCSLGLYNAAVSEQIREEIAAIMVKAYAAEDAINAATSIDALLAVVMEA